MSTTEFIAYVFIAIWGMLGLASWGYVIVMKVRSK